MVVRVAKTAGFCFGVKRAVSMVYEAAEKYPGRVYTMGPIIHNEQVVEDLAEKGVRVIDDSLLDEETGEAPPAGSVVIVRSHGISREMTERLGESGYKVITATCPFVSKIHDIAAKKSAEGYSILIVGNPGHPEVQGIRGWAGEPCAVVENAEQARALSLPKERPVWMVAQTTFQVDKFEELVEIVKGMGYSVRVTNTICNATKERQTESKELAGISDTMLVIGGKHSSNTQKLYEICSSRCERTYYIQSPEDLESVVLHSDSCIGITAGASTPNTIIQEVLSNVRGTEL